MSSPAPAKEKATLLKIVVLGTRATGKTAFIQRYVNNSFMTEYKATIGVDFAYKQIMVDGKPVHLQLWDVSGDERFGNLTSVYFRHAVGAFVTYDLSEPGTMESVARWKEELDQKAGQIPAILLANKCDLNPDGVLPTDQELRDLNFSGCFKTSAKENIGVEDAVLALVRESLKFHEAQQSGPANSPSPAAQTVSVEAPVTPAPSASPAGAAPAGGADKPAGENAAPAMRPLGPYWGLKMGHRGGSNRETDTLSVSGGKELKKQAWRDHRKYNTWFQRHSDLCGHCRGRQPPATELEGR
ncbi:putative ras-related protein Rab-32 [Paratrimastix pyriformis]|uniref:Ras-related protein Rab-32 n=1 Tax=Paratrimastix pyriformis TaxID=342808 RepID=A0ABQ8U575_9EUKA|nr:putative ras-related protein Rab-32 [Paratrimastix pyriformis]